MKTIKLLKSWESEYADAPAAMKLEFSDNDIEKIKKHTQYSKENNVTIDYPFWAELFSDEECEEESDFRAEGEKIIITQSGRMYFTAVHKHNYEEKFESDAFRVEDIE